MPLSYNFTETAGQLAAYDVTIRSFWLWYHFTMGGQGTQVQIDHVRFAILWGGKPTDPHPVTLGNGTYRIYHSNRFLQVSSCSYLGEIALKTTPAKLAIHVCESYNQQLGIGELAAVAANFLVPYPDPPPTILSGTQVHVPQTVACNVPAPPGAPAAPPAAPAAPPAAPQGQPIHASVQIVHGGQQGVGFIRTLTSSCWFDVIMAAANGNQELPQFTNENAVFQYDLTGYAMIAQGAFKALGCHELWRWGDVWDGKRLVQELADLAYRRVKNAPDIENCDDPAAGIEDPGSPDGPIEILYLLPN